MSIVAPRRTHYRYDVFHAVGALSLLQVRFHPTCPPIRHRILTLRSEVGTEPGGEP